MNRPLKYRGRKPRHARDPLAVRPAERRAASEPRIAIRLPRGVLVDLLGRWSRYRRSHDAHEAHFLPTVERAVPYLDRLVNHEFPIAGEIDVQATWTGWTWLVNFALRVKAREFGTRVIPILSQRKYHSEAEEEPSTDEFSTPAALEEFAALRGELERSANPN